MFFSPDPGYPRHGEDKEGLQRQAGPTDPGLGWEAMNLYLCHSHVDVGGKDRHEQQDQSPAGNDLNLAFRNQQSQSAEQFEDAADLNAKQMEGDPWRHDGKEKGRVKQVDAAGKQEKRGQSQTKDKTGDHADKMTGFTLEGTRESH